MAIVSLGYDGSVGEADWARLAPWLGSRAPVVGGPHDFEVVPSSGHQVRVRAGIAAGHGVTDTSDADIALPVPPATSSVRHDCVVLRRDWQGTSPGPSGGMVGGQTTVTLVPGGSAPVRPLLTTTPGVVAMQPLALVRVTPGAAGVTIAEDYRAIAGTTCYVQSAAAGRDLPIGSIFVLPDGSQYTITAGDAGQPVVTPWRVPAAPAAPAAPAIPRIASGTATGVVFSATGAAVISHGLGYRPRTMLFAPRLTAASPQVTVALSVQSGAITETLATLVAKTTTGPYTGTVSWIDWIAAG